MWSIYMAVLVTPPVAIINYPTKAKEEKEGFMGTVHHGDEVG